MERAVILEIKLLLGIPELVFEKSLHDLFLFERFLNPRHVHLQMARVAHCGIIWVAHFAWTHLVLASWAIVQCSMPIQPLCGQFTFKLQSVKNGRVLIPKNINASIDTGHIAWSIGKDIWTDDGELVYRLFVVGPLWSFRSADATKFRIFAHREFNRQRKRFATCTSIIVHHNHYHHRRRCYHRHRRLIIVVAVAVAVAIISSTLWVKTHHGNVRLLCCA